MPVSHGVEKQFAIEHVERVYCLAPCIRLLQPAEHLSGQHLCSFFQVEVEIRTDDLELVFSEAESLLQLFATNFVSLQSGHPFSLDIDTVGRIGLLQQSPFPRISFSDAESILNVKKPPKTDLSNEDQRQLAGKFGTPVWITDYPEGVRDTLYRQNEKGKYDTFDLILPLEFGELSSGGIRPESKSEILRQSDSLGRDYHPAYAGWKERTRMQSGGFGFGFERLVQYCSGCRKILELRLPHDGGPNSRIGCETGAISD